MTEPLIQSDESNVTAMSLLSWRLITPSFVMSIVLLGLTALPMTSCSNGSQSRNLIPLEFLLATDSNNSPASVGTLEFVSEFISAIPLKFMFTWPYFMGIPMCAAMLLIRFTRRGATQTWRMLLLVIGIAVSALYLPSPEWGFRCAGGLGMLAVLIWIASSPVARKLARKCYVPGRFVDRLDRYHRVKGGFDMTSILCVASIIFFVNFDVLLIGGLLAALTIVAIACIAFWSARQSLRDTNRFPQVYTRDLLVMTMLVAIVILML